MLHAMISFTLPGHVKPPSVQGSPQNRIWRRPLKQLQTEDLKPILDQKLHTLNTTINPQQVLQCFNSALSQTLDMLAPSKFMKAGPIPAPRNWFNKECVDRKRLRNAEAAGRKILWTLLN